MRDIFCAFFGAAKTCENWDEKLGHNAEGNERIFELDSKSGATSNETSGTTMRMPTTTKRSSIWTTARTRRGTTRFVSPSSLCRPPPKLGYSITTNLSTRDHIFQIAASAECPPKSETARAGRVLPTTTTTNNDDLQFTMILLEVCSKKCFEALTLLNAFLFSLTTTSSKQPSPTNSQSTFNPSSKQHHPSFILTFVLCLYLIQTLQPRCSIR